jgi:nicotinate-nucleotide--dimethylbenzimidazole phosphoribosyltransferase
LGIGNSTAAAALLSALTGHPPEETVGRGTGLDETRRAEKVRIVREALTLHRVRRDDPIAAIAAVGGLEIGAMAGAIVGAASRRVPVLVDGFIATVAALLAVEIVPRARDYLGFAHSSTERGHRLACAALDARPLLDLDLCLGEGTGVSLAIPIVKAAVMARHEIATFSTAGVPDRVGPNNLR